MHILNMLVVCWFPTTLRSFIFLYHKCHRFYVFYLVRRALFWNNILPSPSCMRPSHGETTSKQEAYKLKFLLLGYLTQISHREIVSYKNLCILPLCYLSRSIKLFMCQLVDNVKFFFFFFFFLHTLSNVLDNSSHDHPMGPLVWTHPQGTCGLGPANPRVTSIDLHTRYNTWWISLFPKIMWY